MLAQKLELLQGDCERALSLYQSAAKTAYDFVSSPGRASLIEMVKLMGDDMIEESPEARHGHWGEEDEIIQVRQSILEERI